LIVFEKIKNVIVFSAPPDISVHDVSLNSSSIIRLFTRNARRQYLFALSLCSCYEKATVVLYFRRTLTRAGLNLLIYLSRYLEQETVKEPFSVFESSCHLSDHSNTPFPCPFRLSHILVYLFYFCPSFYPSWDRRSYIINKQSYMAKTAKGQENVKASPLSALPKGTISELAGLPFTLSFNTECQAELL